MVVQISRRSISILILSIALYYAVSADAKNENWLRLQTPRFGIISQLNEKETKTWAEEFDKFVTALHQLYNVDDSNLIPLTIVIFKSRKQFTPYCNSSDSRQAKKIAGLFANRDDWSIIGLPGLRDYKKTRRTILHEAVHWYTHSRNFNSPLWLEEGIAEVFSTFEIKNDKGRWGLLIQSHVDYLNYKRLQPTREFLLASQDEALNELDTYYSQAWAMVHYFMFGNGGKNREKFSAFLSDLRKKSTERSFESTFGISYEEFDRDLERYIRGGKYSVGEIELNDNNTVMEVGPASDAMVQFALGRLAVGTGNYDKGVQHAEAVISNAPSRPEGYELLAMASKDPAYKTKKSEALEKAIRFNSSDSQIYLMQAAILQEENWKKNSILNKALDKNVARQIADIYKKSISIRPENKTAFEGFALALFNLDTYEVEDRQVLELGRRLFPQEGTIPAGFAALAMMDGDIDSFNQSLEASYRDPMHLSIDLKMSLRGMQQATYYEWFMETLGPLMQKGDFETAEALFEEQKALSYESKDLQKILDDIDIVLYSAKRLYSAEVAMRSRQFNEAEAILEDIKNDEKIPRLGKNAARIMLSQIEKYRKPR